jgi:hypothetical protein
MKKVNKTSKIIDYKKANPDATYAEIAKYAECKVGTIGNVLRKAKMSRKYTSRKTVAPTQGQQVLRDHIVKEDKKTATEIHRLNVQVFTMRQQIAGYVAIISYLEHKLGIKEDGATV